MTTDELSTYWCKTRYGIVEHQATPHTGHRGHVHCIPVYGQSPERFGGAITDEIAKRIDDQLASGVRLPRPRRGEADG